MVFGLLAVYRTETMHQLLCFKSKFSNHFVFTLEHYLFLLFEEEGHRSFPEMLASEAATSPPQRPRVRVFFVGFGDSVVEHVDLCLLLLCGIVVLAGGVGN